MSIKIKELRTERDWTQDELANRSGVDRATLASIETGKAKNPTTINLLKLARVFNIRPEELYQAAGYIQYVRPIFPWQKERPEEILDRFRIAMPATVPIYEDYPFHAGAPVEPMDYVPVVRDITKGRNLEGYIVHGDCLQPEIQDGDVIIVDRDGQIDIGNIVVCLFRDMLHLGRLRKIGDEMHLRNNDSEIKLDWCQVAAPVIEVRRRLK